MKRKSKIISTPLDTHSNRVEINQANSVQNQNHLTFNSSLNCMYLCLSLSGFVQQRHLPLNGK